MSKQFTTYTKENGGRVIVLLLLFLMSLYQLHTMGIGGMAMVCSIPLLVFGLYIVFQYKMAAFWVIFVINYLIMGLNRYYSVPIPVTGLTIFPQLLLLMVCIFDIRHHSGAKYANLMLLSIVIWSFYIFLQLFNETCNLPISVSSWFTNFVFYAIAFFAAYFLTFNLLRTPIFLMRLFRIWAYLCIAACFWAWRQETFGFDDTEWAWLMSGGMRTHLIGGSIRYFSFFSDAANFGCSIAASATAFYILAITTKLRKDKILFFITALCCTYGFFLSGTRSGLLCFLVGIALYVIISKSFHIAIPVGILGGAFFFVLAFTQIGQGNMQIRRMRSAFDKDDKSANVRDINKAALKKYLRDAPFGMGMNVDEGNVPANHKYKIVYETANDSTYVFLWQRTGIIGAVLFAICNGLILIGGCFISMFVLKNKACKGIAAAYCCAFLSIQTGGYANHILLQYPNVLLYYGGMAIVYMLPGIERKFENYENILYKEQEEKERLKLEKKLASRV